MATAKILINGAAGSNVGITLGSTVQLSNEDNSGVLTPEWSMLSVPPGSSASISNPAASAPTFIADVAGSYLIKLDVNDGESVHQEIAAALGERTDVRIPAYTETMEFGGQGWAASRYADLMKIDRILASGSPVVCKNGTGSVIASKKILEVDSVVIPASGAPIPTIRLASDGSEIIGIYGICMGGIDGLQSVNDGDNLILVSMGPALMDTSSFAVGGTIYVGDSGEPSDSGSVALAVVLVSGVNGVVWVNPQVPGPSGDGGFPPVADGGLWPRFMLYGAPLDIYPLHVGIDGKYPIPEAGNVRWMYAIRNTAGASGETLVNAYLNGSPLLSGDDRISFVNYDGDESVKYCMINEDCSAGDILEVRLEGVEAGGAEDLYVVFLVQTPVPPARFGYSAPLIGPFDAINPLDLPARLGRFVVPYSGDIRSLSLWRGTAGTSGSTVITLLKVQAASGSYPGETLTDLYQGSSKPTATSLDGDDYVSLVGPPSSASVVAGDILEVRLEGVEAGGAEDLHASLSISAGGDMKSTMSFEVQGDVSIPSLPFSMDGKHIVVEDGELLNICIARRVPGSSGSICIDVTLDGNSVFSGGAPYYYGGCYPGSGGGPGDELLSLQTDEMSKCTDSLVLTEVNRGGIIEVLVVSVEDGSPEDIDVTITTKINK